MEQHGAGDCTRSLVGTTLINSQSAAYAGTLCANLTIRTVICELARKNFSNTIVEAEANPAPRRRVKAASAGENGVDRHEQRRR